MPGEQQSMIRIVKTPSWLRWSAPSLIWKVKDSPLGIYLTFYDGPVPEATPFVLSLLEKYRAGATFFCVGDNIRKHPEIFRQVVAAGHGIGNHTFNHLNGWRTGSAGYFKNIRLCDELIRQHGGSSSPMLFRPPHGKMTINQYRYLKKNYRIVMWDVLTWDFSPGDRPDRLFERILISTHAGSIVVFHDSEKTLPGLKIFLEPFLEYFSSKGYRFLPLENSL